MQEDIERRGSLAVDNATLLADRGMWSNILHIGTWEQWLTSSHTHPHPTPSSLTPPPLTDLLEAIPELGEDITNHPGSTLNYMALALHTVSQLKGGGGGRKGVREGRKEGKQ